MPVQLILCRSKFNFRPSLAMNTITKDSSGSRRFDVALPFPGEHRPFVEQVAGHLASTFGKDRVLYDKYHEAEFARPNLDVYLPELYRAQSELIVLFLCPEYAAKRWCNLEWRHIRDLLASVDEDRIMFLRYGYDGDFEKLGILRGYGTVNFEGRPANEIAELILQRFRVNHPITSPKSPSDPDRPPIPADISRIIKYAPAQLIGREDETKLLNDAWAKAQNNETKRPHVLTFVALGGEGKTSLVAKWAAVLAHQDWPGCDAVFAWSFYSQGTREQVAASSDVFLKEALTFFGDAEMAGSAQGAFDKGRRLAKLVGERRALLILDGLEPLQYAPGPPMDGKLKDDGLAALLNGLAASNKGLCVVTTRYSIPDLQAYVGGTVREEVLKRLSNKAGVELLRRLGVKGTQAEFETLVEEVKGHALTLNLLGTYLRDAYAGDIRKRDQVRLEEADEEQGGHAFRVMDAYVRWFESEGRHGKRALALLRLLGLFGRPADAGCLKALWEAPLILELTEPLAGISEAHRNLAITRLNDAKLLTVNRDGSGALLALDAHPLLREYFAKALREQRPEAWRATHRRLYEHLCKTTKDKPQPTLEDLQPLYQAVAHGCQAGMQQEACDKVYRDRIQRGQEDYTTHKLGAFGSDLGAVACFFAQPWSRVSPALAEAAQAWMLNNAACNLRALGRVKEALEPMRASLAMHVKREDWGNAARSACNLGELELSLGEMALAVADAGQSVTYAERNGEAFLRTYSRAFHANALHQAGRWDEAAARFREAEEIQAGWQPEHPLLYSGLGFPYCELLLAAAERAACRRMLQLSHIAQPASLLETCRAVSKRAARTLRWDELGNLSFLAIAVDHLTLGRAALYAAILEGIPLDQLDHHCRKSLLHAVDGLRRAGMQDYLPLGLLTRAWLRFLTGAHIGPESAQRDLDEAFEIAERGPMPLHLADIHLHRARLFGLTKDRVPATRPRRGAAFDRKAWLRAAERGTRRRRSSHERTLSRPSAKGGSLANPAAAA
jgi:hypothetical protein